MTNFRFPALLRLLLGICLLLSQGPRLVAQTAGAGPIIRQIDVQFVGPTTLSKERVLDNLATKVGVPYNERLVEEDIKSLYATGNVTNARIFAEPMGDGVKVTVLLQGRPVIQDLFVRFQYLQ